METETVPVPVAAPAPTADGPIAMSFPGILRNPGVSRFLAERVVADKASAMFPAVRKKSRRDEKEGKRWIRRDENWRFVHNPHVVRATRQDIGVPLPSKRSTFPEPLPAYLSRTAPVPTSTPPTMQPLSASAGRFSLSLKGMRRELRGSGPATESLVQAIEATLLEWLDVGGVMLAPDSPAARTLDLPGRPIASDGRVREVQRTPLQLVWDAEDNFTRYVIHCCARFHEVVSFSKDAHGHRLTHLLRPNVTRVAQDARAANPLQTPPTTDLSELSALSSHELELDTTDASDVDRALSESDADRLSAIAESDSRPGSPAFDVTRVRSDDEWSLIHEADGEDDTDADADSDAGLADSISSLAVIDDVDRTPRPALPRRVIGRAASEPWARQDRAASSPSRSPARRAPRRTKTRAKMQAKEAKKGKLFFEYLFA